MIHFNAYNDASRFLTGFREISGNLWTLYSSNAISYAILSDVKGFDDAVTTCKNFPLASQGQSANLLEINGKAEMNLVKEMIESHDIDWDYHVGKIQS